MSDDLDVPDEYDEPAYRAGYARAMTEIGRAALQGAAVIAPDQVPEDDEPAGVCDECGAEPVPSMGADETVTPAGTVCPGCEL